MSAIEQAARNHFDAVVLAAVRRLPGEWSRTDDIHREVCSYFAIQDVEAPSIRKVARSLGQQVQEGLLTRKTANGSYRYRVAG